MPNQTLHFQPTSKIPGTLRARYLDSLPEPQELFLEDAVQSGAVWVLPNLAYAVVNGTELVEFYSASQDHRIRANQFELIMQSSATNTLLCKSFDAPLMFTALSRAQAPAYAINTVGLLFRRIANPSFEERTDVTIRIALPSDATRVWEMNDDFFLSLTEIHAYIAKQRLFVGEIQDQLTVCGIGTDVVPGRRDVDIGMLVAKGWRGRGFASYMIGYLKDRFLHQGLRPICGCAADNLASAAALKRAGFVTEHKLLRIRYK